MTGMSYSLSILSRLSAYRLDLLRQAPPPPADVDRLLRPFIECAAALETRVSGHVAAVPADLVAASREEWKSVSPEVSRLSRRSLRVLCGDPTTTDDHAFMHALVQSGELDRSRWLAERLLDAYDIGWTPTRAQRLAPIIREAFAKQTRRSLKASAFLGERAFLSDRANEAIAERAVEGLLNPAALGERFHIAQDGQLLAAARNAIGPVWARRLETTRDEAGRRELLKFGFDFLVEPATVTARDRSEALGQIILATKPADAGAVAWLRSHVLRSRHFGDPRKPANRNNWALVSSAAKQQFVRWLAKEDLRFFFEAVMANTPDPHGREAFWSRWLDNNRLIDSCVALSAKDLNFLKSRNLIASDAYFSRVDHDEVSAFLLRFRTSTGDIVAIEFSQAGNAAYFHDGAKFDEVVGDIHRSWFKLSGHLKNRDTELLPPPGLGTTWDYHRQGWEDNFRRALSYYLR